MIPISGISEMILFVVSFGGIGGLLGYLALVWSNTTAHLLKQAEEQSEALLRSNELAQALTLLQESVKLWPDHGDVQVRWAAALSRTGQPDEAIKVLDGYLSKHPDDTDRLLVAMRLLYDARILGRPLLSAEEDRTRFMRYFSAYEKLNGAKLPQASEWKKHFQR